MSTSRLTFGAVLGTVQTTANTITSSLDVINSGVSMLTTYVSGAAENQRIRAIADKESFLENLTREKAYEEAASTLKVAKFCQQSADHLKFYTEAYETYSKLLRPSETN